MLVLSRKKSEQIVFQLTRKALESLLETHPDGCELTATVVEIRGDKVRIGTEAPKCVATHRREVLDAIQREQRQAG